MKRIFVFVLAGLFFASCDPVDGNLVGVKGRDTFYPDILGPGKVPYGMVYIPSGAYQAGQNDKDIMGLHTTRNRTVSVQAFYMDASEITNNEYRQFVNWVRDSIAREKLYMRQSGDDAEEWVNVPDDFFKEPYRTVIQTGSDVQGANNPFEPFLEGEDALDLDRAYLLLMGYDGATKGTAKGKGGGKGKGGAPAEISKFFKNVNFEHKDDEPIDITFNPDEISAILSVVSSPLNQSKGKGAKGKSGGKGSVPFDDPKNKMNEDEELKQVVTTNGGRYENRKYFTLNWETPIEYADPEIAFLLSDMYYSEEEQYFKNKQIDTRLLFYDYMWIDYKEAAKRGKVKTAENSYDKSINAMQPQERRNPLSKDDKSNGMHRATLTVDNKDNDVVWYDGTSVPVDEMQGKLSDSLKNQLLPKTDNGSLQLKEETGPQTNNNLFNNPGQDLDLGFSNSKGQHNAIRGHADRSRYIIKERINVYPDTLCWVRDYTYAYHDPMAENYFWHTAYDNYPVVGVTWCQAKAFSVWRTQLYHSWLLANGDLYVNDFRLPSEVEWERAARGDLELSQYPWGGPYIRNANGCFLANFKPMRGRYFEDGGFHTVKVYSYNPNAFGLYCMAGNVAEWCNTAFDESAYEFTHDMNSEYAYDAKDDDHPVKKRKVIRGGSWKDIGYYLQNSTRTFEYQDTAKCYIGFRNVMTHLGRGGKDIDAENGEEIQMDIQLK
jgi:formylglycine-generating enzyme required for sulfatase activity